MMSTSHIQTLRAMLREEKGVILPGAPNALAARIIADLGFKAVYLTGAGLTNTYLGLPDLGFMDLSLVADHVMAIRCVIDLPLIVDIDTGFGNAVNVTHTVRILEQAGASAIQIEDQHAPKRCGHFDGKELIPLEEMVGKVRAAFRADHRPVRATDRVTRQPRGRGTRRVDRTGVDEPTASFRRRLSPDRGTSSDCPARSGLSTRRDVGRRAQLHRASGGMMHWRF
jgi:2-methylisocitrate lyase-like PEP mutase family enzyme